MADDKDKLKARLYRDIVRRNPPQLLLARMRLYGFWPADRELPEDPPAEAAERQDIERQLAVLRDRHASVKDPDKALAEERRRRWQASKQRRAEAKAQRQTEAERRRAAWQRTRRLGVVHAGVGVSAGLNGKTDAAGLAALRDRGLPELIDAAGLAAALNIDLATLRWLTFHRPGAELVHYHRYTVAKKTGGRRAISAPKPQLAAAQRWLLDKVLRPLAVEPEAHGFVPGRSIVSNAAGHCGRAVVINLDLEDFFPGITFPRIKGLFRRFGYGEQVASLLALLCSEPPRAPVELDGKRYYVALGQRRLPQGACTSPALSNLLCRKLDRRLYGLATKLGFVYSRYADDLSFSGDDPARAGQLLRCVRKVLTAEGLAENPAKTRVMRRGRRQRVTGLTVNDKPALPRAELRRLKAMLHNAARHGVASQNRNGHPNFKAYLRGRVALACMVDPQHAALWRERLARALGFVPK